MVMNGWRIQITLVYKSYSNSLFLNSVRVSLLVNREMISTDCLLTFNNGLLLYLLSLVFILLLNLLIFLLSDWGSLSLSMKLLTYLGVNLLSQTLLNSILVISLLLIFSQTLATLIGLYLPSMFSLIFLSSCSSLCPFLLISLKFNSFFF